MNGKGDKPRPFSVPADHFAAEFDRIFGQRECTPVPLYPQHEPESEPDGSPDWQATGV